MKQNLQQQKKAGAQGIRDEELRFRFLLVMIENLHLYATLTSAAVTGKL